MSIMLTSVEATSVKFNFEYENNNFFSVIRCFWVKGAKIDELIDLYFGMGWAAVCSNRPSLPSPENKT